MAKSKYDSRVFPLKVEKLARDGFSDREIYKQLGISKDTFYHYLRQYPDFSDAHKRGREPVTAKVENAYLSRCLGIEYDKITKKVIQVPHTTITKVVDKKGRVIDVKEKTEIQKSVQISSTNTKVLPDVGACKHWLYTNDPKWNNSKDKGSSMSGFHSISDFIVAFNEKQKKEDQNEE